MAQKLITKAIENALNKTPYGSGDGIVHCESGIGGDYTVCGLSTSDDERLGIKMVETKEKITCKTCIDEIGHCKGVRKSEIGIPAQEEVYV